VYSAPEIICVLHSSITKSLDWLIIQLARRSVIVVQAAPHAMGRIDVGADGSLPRFSPAPADLVFTSKGTSSSPLA
jgi:hypothetical protein